MSRPHLGQVAVYGFSVVGGVYINVSVCVVNRSDLEHVLHVPCRQCEVHLEEEEKQGGLKKRKKDMRTEEREEIGARNDLYFYYYYYY